MLTIGRIAYRREGVFFPVDTTITLAAKGIAAQWVILSLPRLLKTGWAGKGVMTVHSAGEV